MLANHTTLNPSAVFLHCMSQASQNLKLLTLHGLGSLRQTLSKTGKSPPGQPHGVMLLGIKGGNGAVC